MFQNITFKFSRSLNIKRRVSNSLLPFSILYHHYLYLCTCNLDQTQAFLDHDWGNVGKIESISIAENVGVRK